MRYIDAKKIEYHELSVCGGHGMNCEYTVAYKHEVDAIPTADVVPKSEYDAVVSAVDNSTKEFLKLHDDYQEAKSEVERLYYNLQAVLEERAETKQEIAREIFEEIEKLTASVYNDFMFNREGVGMQVTKVIEFSDDLDLAIAELKKKYTGGKT